MVYASHYARLSDGRSAGARDAEVRLSTAGIEISGGETGGRRLWKYESLASTEPIRNQSVDVLLSSRTEPGVTLFVPGAAFAAELLIRAPQLHARAERWRHAKPWLAGAFALFALVALMNALGLSPSHGLATVLPESWRSKLGTEAMRSMTEGKKRCTDKAGLSAMDMMVKRLSQSSGRTESFKVVIADWSLLNAFAVPGSQIVMTKALIEKADGPDEVAGVLAHEMGHGIALHPETGIIRAVGMAAALEFMMGGTGGTLANLGLALAQLSYTRAAEHEADLKALELLKQAQISPKALGEFFKRLDKEDGDSDIGKAMKDFNILRTHPPTAERADLVAKQPAYPATPSLDDESWQALKRVCSATAEFAQEKN